jgi:hypothetical protein
MAASQIVLTIVFYDLTALCMLHRHFADTIQFHLLGIYLMVCAMHCWEEEHGGEVCSHHTSGHITSILAVTVDADLDYVGDILLAMLLSFFTLVP